MPTRAQVLAMVDSGVPYPEVGRRLGISPGLAYMIATGLPADGSGGLTTDDRDRPGFLPGSTQHLANRAEPENPTRKPEVLDWIKQRVHQDAQMRQAAAARSVEPAGSSEEDDDLCSALTRDHDAVMSLLQQLSAIPGHVKGGTPTQIDRRGSIVDVLVRELRRHAASEKRVLWPAVRTALPDGADLAKQGQSQERALARVTADLAKSTPDSPEFDELVDDVALGVRKHVAFVDRLCLRLRERES